MKKDIKASVLVDAIYAVDRKLITDVYIFDLYTGDKLASDEKSIALKVVFTPEETLKDEDINARCEKIIKKISYMYNAKLRS